MFFTPAVSPRRLPRDELANDRISRRNLRPLRPGRFNVRNGDLRRFDPRALRAGRNLRKRRLFPRKNDRSGALRAGRIYAGALRAGRRLFRRILSDGQGRGSGRGRRNDRDSEQNARGIRTKRVCSRRDACGGRVSTSAILRVDKNAYPRGGRDRNSSGQFRRIARRHRVVASIPGAPRAPSERRISVRRRRCLQRRTRARMVRGSIPINLNPVRREKERASNERASNEAVGAQASRRSRRDGGRRRRRQTAKESKGRRASVGSRRGVAATSPLIRFNRLIAVLPASGNAGDALEYAKSGNETRPFGAGSGVGRTDERRVDRRGGVARRTRNDKTAGAEKTAGVEIHPNHRQRVSTAVFFRRQPSETARRRALDRRRHSRRGKASRFSHRRQVLHPDCRGGRVHVRMSENRETTVVTQTARSLRRQLAATAHV